MRDRGDHATRATGPGGHRRIRIDLDRPSAVVHGIVVGVAEQQTVVDRRGTLVAIPPRHVVHVAPRRWPVAARSTAGPVPCDDSSSLRRTPGTRRTSHVQHLRWPGHDDAGHVGVADDPAYCLGGDQLPRPGDTAGSREIPQCLEVDDHGHVWPHAAVGRCRPAIQRRTGRSHQGVRTTLFGTPALHDRRVGRVLRLERADGGSNHLGGRTVEQRVQLHHPIGTIRDVAASPRPGPRSSRARLSPSASCSARAMVRASCSGVCSSAASSRRCSVAAPSPSAPRRAARAIAPACSSPIRPSASAASVPGSVSRSRPSSAAARASRADTPSLSRIHVAVSDAPSCSCAASFVAADASRALAAVNADRAACTCASAEATASPSKSPRSTFAIRRHACAASSNGTSRGSESWRPAPAWVPAWSWAPPRPRASPGS
jgi:hypothetical protein